DNLCLNTVSMTPENDAQLIKQYLKGDEESLRVLYEQYVPSVYNFIFRLAPSGFDVEDIVQEAFVKAWLNLKKFDQSKSFKTWIFTIAKNVLFDQIKKKQPIAFSQLESDEEGNVPDLDVADSRPLADEILNAIDSDKRFEELLQILNPVQRAVVISHAIEGLTFSEIGEVLGQPMDTVKTRYRRAIGKLQAYLNQNNHS
ncbi:MAG: RNA polymerase sigma factor, partial [Patescibacteria group bacterium]|nr:RNA polymerase sigma factor [Patescibacteria group bacterium]